MVRANTVHEQLRDLGITLPRYPKPVGSYAPYVRMCNLIFLAGQGPIGDDGVLITGKVGETVSTEQAYQHARLVGLQMLAVINDATSGFEDFVRVGKIFGMVNAVPEFKDHPKVINGCSDLMIEILGDAGRHARSAVGMGSLPLDMTVEIEAVIEVRE